MARGVFSTANFLKAASAPVSDFPFAISAWVYTTDLTVNQTIAGSFSDTAASDYFRLSIFGAEVGDPIRWEVRRSSIISSDTTSGITANTWHHVLGSSPGTNTHRVYIDGGSKGLATGTATFPANLDNFGIGLLTRASVTQPLIGYVAEVAFFNRDMWDDDAASLAKGYYPVRPLHYWPCGGLIAAKSTGNELDIVGGLTATENGTVGSVDHPSGLIYPSQQFIPFPSAAGLPIPVASHHYTKNIGAA